MINAMTQQIGMALQDEKPPFVVDLSKYVIDLSQEIKEPEPVLSIGEETLFTLGNISTIGGLAKSRKTFLVSLLSFMYLEENTGLVLILDTEQAPFHTARVARRIHRLLRWELNRSNDQLKVLSLRELSAEERTEALKQSIITWNPQLVFIDGVRDLVKDFNSPDESSTAVNLLMRLSSQYNCHICSILHENKIGGQLRGHLGTEIQNKSETVIGVSTDENVTTVKPLFTRNKPFEEFHFRIDEAGLPELCGVPKKPKNNFKLRGIFEELLQSGQTVSFADLRSMVMSHTGKVSRTAERHIKDAVSESIIIKNAAGQYYLQNKEAYDEPLPF